MKKLYIGFILLVFLAFGTQISLADAPYSPKVMLKIMQGNKKRKDMQKQYSSCLQEYKSKLPQKYSRPNLKIESDEIAPHVANRWTSNVDYWFETKNEYFLDVETPNGASVIKLESLAHDCNTEYLPIRGWTPKNVNVINIPTGSHLKYIPGTDEMQVLPPNNIPYKKIHNTHPIFDQLYEQMKEGFKTKNEKDLRCLNNKKPGLTAKYTEHNIKPEIVEKSAIESKGPRHCISRYNRVVHTLAHTENKYDIGEPSWWNGNYKKSFICDCEEYIEIRAGDYKYYNVTDVPPNSRLEYISETEEMKVTPITKEIIEIKLKKEFLRKDALVCIYNKKLNLPQKYTGSNLKLKSDEKAGRKFDTGLLYSHAHTHKYAFPREFYAIADVKFYTDDIRVSYYESDVLYDGNNCEEHLLYGSKYFDVTNVPHDSYFSYISESNEIKILRSENNLYKQYIKNKIKVMETKANEAQESINKGDLKLMIKNLEELRKVLDQKITPYENIESIKEIVKQTEGKY